MKPIPHTKETTRRKQAYDQKTIFLSCVVPVYNESALIVPFIQHLTSVLHTLTTRYEIIVVDDGSTDATLPTLLSLAEQGLIKLLGFSRNFGKELALTAGIEHATGDVVILIDGDFQHPAELIPTFVQHWVAGYEMVYGTRHDRANESKIKRYFTYLFYWIMQKISQLDLPNNAGDFRLLDKKIIDAFKQFNERTRFMKGLYAWVGYSKIAVPYTVQERPNGKSRFRLQALTELAVTGMTSFSDIPLRVWGWVGFIVSCIAMIYAVYILTRTLMYGTDLPGFPTIIIAIMFLGGIQLLSIGILGEYIARIFTEVKQRPKYLLTVKTGF